MVPCRALKIRVKVTQGLVLCALTREMGGLRVAQGIDGVEGNHGIFEGSDILQF